MRSLFFFSSRDTEFPQTNATIYECRSSTAILDLFVLKSIHIFAVTVLSNLSVLIRATFSRLRALV